MKKWKFSSKFAVPTSFGLFHDIVFWTFVYFRFTGLSRSDDILSYLKLIMSRNPDAYIDATMISYSTDTTYCEKTASCGNGFVLDPVNFICYKTISIKRSYSESHLCGVDGAGFPNFNNDAEIDGFLSIIKSGNYQLLCTCEAISEVVYASLVSLII